MARQAIVIVFIFGLVFELLLGCGRVFLFFGGGGWRPIDNGRVVFHLLFLLCRRADDRRVLLDKLVRGWIAHAGIAGGQEECRGGKDDR